jgi:hypothetical protein
MKAFYLVFATCGVMFAIFGLTSSAIMNEMVDKLNRILPEQNRFSPMWWWPIKYFDFLHTYRDAFPEDKLLFWYRVTLFCGFTTLIASACYLFWPR